MITVTMEMPLQPGKLADFQKAIAAAIKDTAKMPGFRAIYVLPPMAGDDKALIVEEWDSQAAHQGYLDWRAAGNPAAGVGECLAGKPNVQFWGEAIASE